VPVSGTQTLKNAEIAGVLKVCFHLTRKRRVRSASKLKTDKIVMHFHSPTRTSMGHLAKVAPRDKNVKSVQADAHRDSVHFVKNWVCKEAYCFFWFSKKK
jgi:hypothetical protein